MTLLISPLSDYIKKFNMVHNILNSRNISAGQVQLWSRSLSPKPFILSTRSAHCDWHANCRNNPKSSTLIDLITRAPNTPKIHKPNDLTTLGKGLLLDEIEAAWKNLEAPINNPKIFSNLSRTLTRVTWVTWITQWSLFAIINSSPSDHS